MEVEIEGGEKDEEVEDGGGDGLCDEKVHELEHVVGAQAPAASVGHGGIPVGVDGPAGDKGQDGKGQAPQGGGGHEAFAPDAVSGGGLEEAEVLEKDGELDEGDGERVRDAADVHDLRGQRGEALDSARPTSYLHKFLELGEAHGGRGFAQAQIRYYGG